MRNVTHLIDGKPVSDAAQRTGPVYDPATGAQTGSVPFADQGLLDRAVDAAARTLDEWRETTLVARQRILFAYRELLAAHSEEVARLVTSEHGKTLDDARGEVQRGLEVVEFACGLPHLLKGEFSENVSSGVDTSSLRQPVGVVAGITPFNFPAMVPLWMFPMAIACGNTFVLKPSERDPSAAVFAAELFLEAGLPAGVLNVVHGDKAAVDGLLAHPDIAAVSSVGSTPVARYIYETAAAYGKRVQALGGAKNHMIVLPDADLDAAADAAVSAGYGSAGERCMAVSAVVAVGDAGEQLTPKIADRVDGLQVGAGTEPGVDMGPLITPEHRDRVASYVDAGIEQGAELVRDGRGVGAETADGGFFLGPTLFDRVTSEMSIYRDEIFGPVLCVVRADNYDEALQLVNASPYGNGTAVFTTDGRAARRFQHEIEVGMVGINVPIPVPLSFYSFGGWKASLFGDHDIYGPDAIRFYTRSKVVVSHWPEHPVAGVDTGFPTSR